MLRKRNDISDSNFLMNNFLEFTQAFYENRTGREFQLSSPPGRQSHYLEIIEALEKIVKGECKRLIINVPPRYGKTELLIHFVAWTLARNPDSNFIYVSYSHSLARKQTATIKEIIELPMYKHLFGVHIKDDVSAKDNFEVTHGGSIFAAGAGGSITGRGAGIKGTKSFGGCIVIDDIIKPDEATSDTIREGINEWFYNTLQSRINSPITPIIFIGQRLHEDDLAAHLIATGEWETLIVPAIDAAGNALHPEMHDIVALKRMQETMPYEFAAQYQQVPQPAGGGIFKSNWFQLVDETPDIIATFITADTAETNKDWNDATVFSFWGLHKIKNDMYETDEYGLHWLDCVEIRIEPKDIHSEFLQFYANCMRYKVKPSIAGIEKKSTGVTLTSVLSNHQGLQTIDIQRTRESGSKTARFLAAQPYIAEKRISLPSYGKHTKMCIDHCGKITANGSHRWDDIADTLADAIQLGLVSKVILHSATKKQDYSSIAKSMMTNVNRLDRIRQDAYRK